MKLEKEISEGCTWVGKSNEVDSEEKSTETLRL